MDVAPVVPSVSNGGAAVMSHDAMSGVEQERSTGTVEAKQSTPVMAIPLPAVPGALPAIVIPPPAVPAFGGLFGKWSASWPASSSPMIVRPS